MKRGGRHPYHPGPPNDPEWAHAGAGETGTVFDDNVPKSQLNWWTAVPPEIKAAQLLAWCAVLVTMGIAIYLASQKSDFTSAMEQTQRNQLALSMQIAQEAIQGRQLANTWGEGNIVAFCHILEFVCDDAEYLRKRNHVPNNNQFCSKVKTACGQLLQEASVLPKSDALSLGGLFEKLGTVPGGRLFDRPGPSSLLEGSLHDQNGVGLILSDQVGMFLTVSYYDVATYVPGLSADANDALVWISLNSSSGLANRPTFIYNSGARGGFNELHANMDRVVVPAPDTNEVYVWDISAGVANPSLSIINATQMANGANVSRPWVARELSDGTIVVGALENATGGGNGGLFSVDFGTSPATVARWDDTSDPLAANRSSPGDFAVLDGSANFVQLGSLAPWSTVLGTAGVCFDNATELPLYGRQINLYNSVSRTIAGRFTADTTDITDAVGPVHVTPAFESLVGAIPTIVRRNVNNPDIFGFLSTYTGTVGVGVYTGASDEQPWTLSWISQILPKLSGTTPSVVNAAKLSLPTDMVFSRDGRFLLVAVYGLGQIRAYEVDDTNIPKLCDTAQVTAGQAIFGSNVSYTHPSCPGRVLNGGPAHVNSDPFSDFIYVSSNFVGFDECVYPDLLEAGGWVVRYRLDSECRHGMLGLDAGFCIDCNHLPGTLNGQPARCGAMAFAAGDLRSPSLDPHPYQL